MLRKWPASNQWPVKWLLVFLMLATGYWPRATYADQQEDLHRIEDYLNGLTTIAADFAQIAPDGSLGSGKFYLKRPGKIRWQYDPPTPLLIVSTGSQLVYFDYELGQVTYIPLDSTLASFLAQEHISLTDPFIHIEKVEKSPGMMRISFAQTDKPEKGKLLLEFSDQPLLIRNMVITDSQGQVTTVALNNARFGVELADTLFRFTDPRKRRRR